MSGSPDFNLAELIRRMLNIVRKGTIHSMDLDAATCRVQSGDLLTGWLPISATRAGAASTWWAPSIGEQVVLLCPEGDPAQGVVLNASLYQTAHPAPSASADEHVTDYGDGTVLIYNRVTHVLTINCPDVQLIGTLTVSNDVIAGGISLVDHVHGGVLPGGASTGVPQ